MQKPWPSHRLGSAAASDSVLQPAPPTALGATKLHKHHKKKTPHYLYIVLQQTTDSLCFTIVPKQTIRFLLQFLGESRLADVIHQFEQILPAFAPEAGLDVTQKGQVLLP